MVSLFYINPTFSLIFSALFKYKLFTVVRWEGNQFLLSKSISPTASVSLTFLKNHIHTNYSCQSCYNQAQFNGLATFSSVYNLLSYIMITVIICKSHLYNSNGNLIKTTIKIYLLILNLKQNKVIN